MNPNVYYQSGPQTSNIRSTNTNNPATSPSIPLDQYAVPPSSGITYSNTPRSSNVAPPNWGSESGAMVDSKQQQGFHPQLPAYHSHYPVPTHSYSPNSVPTSYHATTDQYNFASATLATTTPPPQHSLLQYGSRVSSYSSLTAYPSPSNHFGQYQHQNANQFYSAQHSYGRAMKRPYSTIEDLSSSEDSEYDDDTNASTPLASYAPCGPKSEYENVKRRRMASYSGPSTQYNTTVVAPVRSKSTNPYGAVRRKSNLDILSEVSMKTFKESEKSKFLYSSSTYTVSQEIPDETIWKLLRDPVYGGEIIISRKRKQGRVDTTISEVPVVEQASPLSPPASPKAVLSTAPAQASNSSNSSDEKKVAQGRPYSTEMDIEVVFPNDLDHLFSILCTKGAAPSSFKVKLQSNYNATLESSSPSLSRRRGSSQTSSKSKGKKSLTYPIFSNSYEMVNYFIDSAKGFSLVTAIRQSSMQKAESKKGTCPVVKFTVTPVRDYSVQFLKKMAYPRYKADMKVYIIPYQVDEVYDYYTSAAMYLQDQLARKEHEMEFDTKARIFINQAYPELPYATYDRDFMAKEADDESVQVKPEQSECNSDCSDDECCGRKNSLGFILN